MRILWTLLHCKLIFERGVEKNEKTQIPSLKIFTL